MQFNISAEHKHASGVYIIRNSINAKVYVGSAANFWKRYQKHVSNLTIGNHHSQPFQRFSNKYGNGCMSFELLEAAPSTKEELICCEQKWIDFYNAANKAQGYNMAPAAGSLLGYKRPFKKKGPLSEKVKQLLSEHRKQNPIILNPEQRERQRAAVSAAAKLKKGKPATPRTAEQRERQRTAVIAANTGRKMNPESVRKLSEARKGKKRDPAVGAKISAALAAKKAQGATLGRPKGVVFTAEHRQNISAALAAKRVQQPQVS
ncbi:GIY-YIG nuclease family protein [Hymenobacter sp. M29]|uniref:GIY-YIG nuclease family protein n=1 Tax=Hymenobacter mellowenesis TaxID=3063995 RepID=A0ABT9AJU1_9BACT|nr:GIY-YIG nuclease family protein [Hymenobacter sp. M29]MDO7849022.1 GIY-YIG nuclease family protein [Hymenobacter sp. M29]